MLDRDGTLIYERHYLADPDGVELLPGVIEGLKAIRKMGLGLVVVTNQSGIGRGLFDLSMLDKVHERMKRLLSYHGVELDGIYYCPHLPETHCDCRKPAVGMALRAAKELNFEPGEGFMVGDKNVDVQLGKNLGATTVLVLTGYGQDEMERSAVNTDHVIKSLSELPEIVSCVLDQKRLSKGA